MLHGKTAELSLCNVVTMQVPVGLGLDEAGLEVCRTGTEDRLTLEKRNFELALLKGSFGELEMVSDVDVHGSPCRGKRWMSTWPLSPG